MLCQCDVTFVSAVPPMSAGCHLCQCNVTCVNVMSPVSVHCRFSPKSVRCHLCSTVSPVSVHCHLCQSGVTFVSAMSRVSVRCHICVCSITTLESMAVDVASEEQRTLDKVSRIVLKKCNLVADFRDEIQVEPY